MLTRVINVWLHTALCISVFSGHCFGGGNLQGDAEVSPNTLVSAVHAHDYVLEPLLSMLAVANGRLIGLPTPCVRVKAYHWRTKSSAEQYRAAVEYAIACGLTDEAEARAALPCLVFMTPEGNSHIRTTLYGVLDERIYSESLERLASGETHFQYTLRAGRELQETFRLLDGPKVLTDGGIRRWMVTGNRFRDLPPDVSKVLMHMHAAAYALVHTAGEGGVHRLDGDFLARVSEDGPLGSASKLAVQVALKWSEHESSGRMLQLDWKDKNELVVLSQRLYWSGDGAFPNRLDVSDYAPGSDSLISNSTFTLESCPATSLQVAASVWSSDRERPVEDQRFGGVTSYSTSDVAFGDVATAKQMAVQALLHRAVEERYYAPIEVELTKARMLRDPDEANVWGEACNIAGEAVVGVLPARWVSQECPVGSRVPFTFEVHNVAGEELEVVSVLPDCGCVEISPIGGSLERDQVVTLSGVQEVQAVGPSVKKVTIRLRATSGEIVVAEFSILVTGTPAMVSTRPVYMLEHMGELDLFKGTLVCGAFGCATRDNPPSVSCDNEAAEVAAVDWVWGEQFAEGHIALKRALGDAPQRWGFFYESVSVTGPLCPNAGPGRALFFGSRVPIDGGEWPDPWCVLGPGVEEASLEFPVSELEVLTVESGSDVEFKVVRRGGASVMIVRATKFRRGAQSHLVTLGAPSGPIDVLVVLAN